MFFGALGSPSGGKVHYGTRADLQEAEGQRVLRERKELHLGSHRLALPVHRQRLHLVSGPLKKNETHKNEVSDCNCASNRCAHAVITALSAPTRRAIDASQTSGLIPNLPQRAATSGKTTSLALGTSRI